MSTLRTSIPSKLRLGVNVDHVATLRQQRTTNYPDPVYAALIAEQAGAETITVHLREDRRHIQERDVRLLKATLSCRLNLEMAPTPEMLAFALEVRPTACCLVPEKREERTTEGGLDVLAQHSFLKEYCAKLAQAGIEVSLFIEPNLEHIEASRALGVPVVELHTGRYAEEPGDASTLHAIVSASARAHHLGLQVNAGHA